MGTKWQARFALFVVVAYILLFLPLYEGIGHFAYLFAFAPVLAFGMACGAWCALLAGVMVFFIHALLLIHIRDMSFSQFANNGFFFLHTLLLFTGFVVSLIYTQHKQIELLAKRSRDLENGLLETRAKLRQYSTIDEVTGLHNRHGFLEVAGLQMAQADRLGYELYLLCADIIGMGGLNKVYGFKVGDQILKEAATILHRTVRDSDDFTLSRVGSDEFAVLLTSKTPLQGTHPVLLRLKHNLEMFNNQSDNAYHISLTTIVVKHVRGEKIKDMLQNAIEEMYKEWNRSGRRH